MVAGAAELDSPGPIVGLTALRSFTSRAATTIPMPDKSNDSHGRR